MTKMPLSCLLFAAVLHACTSNPRLDETAGVQVRMDFSRAGDLYAAPFPSDDLQDADGTIRIDAFPNPDAIDFVASTLEVIQEEVNGFGVSSAVFFSLTGTPRVGKLPDALSSVVAGSPVFLMSVDPESPDHLRRYPVDVSFTADGGPFGSSNLLSVLPLQGVPLRSGTRYAAVVLRSLGDRTGRPLDVSKTMFALAQGRRLASVPPNVFDAYRGALRELRGAGVAADAVAGMAVFTTGDPAAELGVFREAALALARPKPEAPFALREVFASFCVYDTTIAMPVYQDGEPPFTSEGGGWVVDAKGAPVLQGYEQGKFVVTIPRTAMPSAGYPTVVFIRTGGGGERPLVDRGIRDANGAVLVPGTGPAWEFAKEGFAGVSVDGPHGGLRNVSQGDEQILMFNILNPRAMRDNVRQSALETILLAHILADVSIDVTDCPGTGGGTAKLDVASLALMGHSMGATVAQPVVALEPMYRALILSGAGASWLENLIHKLKPLDVKKIAQLVIGYTSRELTVHDPVVSLVQWAGDTSDAQAYNALVSGATDVSAPHVLMLQGIVDHYIMPPIANATSLSLGLDLAGVPLDRKTAELKPFRPLDMLLPLVGRGTVDYPVAGNAAGARTAVVVQYREDGIEDGHEVAFQTEPPKVQYRCFLRSFARGIPKVIDPAGVCAE